MKGMLAFLGMTLGGWIGWEIGSLVSFFTAFMVSIVGTGAGLYFANRWGKQFLP